MLHLFSSTKVKPLSVNLKVNGNKLEQVTTCSYLGVILIDALCSDRQWNIPAAVSPCRNPIRCVISPQSTQRWATRYKCVSWHVTSYVGNVVRIRPYSRHLSATF